MTLYATGARRAEVARLQVSDIDSPSMVVHIQGGKGHKDRDVMLSPILLGALREHWRGLKPKTWLFPGNRWHTGPDPITSKVIWHACHQAALRARSPQTCSSPHAEALCTLGNEKRPTLKLGRLRFESGLNSYRLSINAANPSCINSRHFPVLGHLLAYWSRENQVLCFPLTSSVHLEYKKVKQFGAAGITCAICQCREQKEFSYEAPSIL